MSVYSWSKTSTSNQTADAAINWQEGQLPSTINDSARAMMAALAAMRDDMGGLPTLGGSGDSFSISLSQPMLSASQGLVSFVATRANAGAVTLQVDGLSALPLRSQSGVELVAGEIVSGKPYLVYKNPSASEWLILNTSPSKSVIDTAVNAKLPLAGGTMTGALVLSGAPTVDLNPASKKYVDDALALYALKTYVDALTPSGTISMFAGSSAPANYLECNGQAVSRTTYAALFAAIGVTHGGGDGSTTFNVPDLRGEFVRGWDHGRGIDSGRALGSAQAEELKAHTHFQSVTTSAGALTGVNGVSGSGASASYVSTQPAGGAETRPRNIALMFIIKT